MGQPVVHFEIGARDGKKAQAFYRELFDWKINVDNAYDYGVVEAGGPGGIGGGIFQLKPGMNPFVAIYIQVDDVPGYLAKAEKLGGKTMMPATTLPGVGIIGMFSDPDGQGIGLYKPEKPVAR